MDKNDIKNCIFLPYKYRHKLYMAKDIPVSMKEKIIELLRKQEEIRENMLLNIRFKTWNISSIVIKEHEEDENKKEVDDVLGELDWIDIT